MHLGATLKSCRYLKQKLIVWDIHQKKPKELELVCHHLGWSAIDTIGIHYLVLQLIVATCRCPLG